MSVVVIIGAVAQVDSECEPTLCRTATLLAVQRSLASNSSNNDDDNEGHSDVEICAAVPLSLARLDVAQHSASNSSATPPATTVSAFARVRLSLPSNLRRKEVFVRLSRTFPNGAPLPSAKTGSHPSDDAEEDEDSDDDDVTFNVPVHLDEISTAGCSRLAVKFWKELSRKLTQCVCCRRARFVSV